MDNPVEAVGLPIRPFLYTLDQVSTLIAVEMSTLKTRYIYFDRRHVGVQPKRKILAVNISPQGSPPDWRVSERELVRWLRYVGIKIYDRTWFDRKMRNDQNKKPKEL